MARTQIGETDTLPASRTYLNANIAKDDALQTATGIPESGTNIGAIGTLPTGAVASTDTLRNAVLKLEGRTPIPGPKHGVDSARTARELGANFNYRDAEYGVEGTTAVDISGAAAQEYPGGDAVYTVEISFSGGAGGSAGRLKYVHATNGTRRYLRIRSEGVWSPWRESAPLGGQSYTLTIDSVGSWSGPDGNGDYTLAILASQHLLGRFANVAEAYANVGGLLSPVATGVEIGAVTGDVTLKVTSSPDNRFVGRVVIRSFA